MNTTYVQPASANLSNEQEDENPFVGLRPYEAEESYLFFGRGKQTTELLQKLSTTRFIGVVGSSGCGKSSLIKAGVIPKLKAGFLTNKRDHWITASMRPAGNPLLFLAESLSAELASSPFIPEECRQNTVDSAAMLKGIHQKGLQAITEILLPVFEKSHSNLLLLVDQFEELFTTKRTDTDIETQMNENVLFVNILLSLSRQKDLPVYVIITMRSDYMGNCNKFYGLPETLNEGQYLVPRVNRQQLNEVAELPIKMNGEKISARLLDQILNDSDKDLDQLPVLQHALMRTYKFWQLRNKITPIDFEDYEAAGKLDRALSNHANDVYNKLDDTQKKIAEVVFRSLTDVNAENVPIRRRQSFKELTEVCRSIKDVSPQQVEVVINIFRARDCAFLTPFTGTLKESTIIDISHESLMRQWDRLNSWMKDEQGSGRKFKWLIESVNNKREPLRGIDLDDASKWMAKQPANQQWASRYQGNYKAVESYIEISRTKARNSRYLRNAVVGIFIAVPLLALAFYNHTEKQNLREKNIITKKFSDSIEYKNRTLNKSLDDQKKLQTDLKLSYEKEILTAANKVKSDIKAERLKDENDRKEREREMEKRNREEVEALESTFKREPFYTALNKENFGNTDNADAIVTALIDSYNKNRKEFSNFHQAITQVFKAQEIAAEDPVSALRLSKEAWQNSKHSIIDANITKQTLNKIFYKQQIVPHGEIGFNEPSLIISGDKKSFAINDGSNKIYIGRVGKDNVSIDENFTYSYANSFKEEDTVTNGYTPIRTFSVKENSAMELDENGNLVSWGNNKKTGIVTIPGIDKFTIAEFSPDHRYLITAPAQSNDAAIKESAVVLWNIADLKQHTVPQKIILNNSITRLKQVAFSPNSRQCFVLDDADLAIYNIGKPGAAPVVVKDVWAAQFTPDGNYLLTLSRKQSSTSRSTASYRTRQIEVRDSIGAITNIRPVTINYNELKDINQLKSFSLSPNWRKLMLKQGAKISIFERAKGDSIISFSNFGSNLELSSVYPVSDTTFFNTTSFVDNNSILSITNEGTIALWRDYPKFKNANEALKNIQLPEVTIAEKIDDRSLTFDEIILRDSEQDLREAASYYEAKSYNSHGVNRTNGVQMLNNSRALYKKLIDKTVGEKRLYYIDKIVSLNRQVSDAASLDTTEQRKVAAIYNENVELLERQMKNYPANAHLIKRLATNYNSLAFNRLFIKQYKGAIDACNKGLSLDPTYTILYTNLALGYLLSENFAMTDKYYRQYKDSSLLSSGDSRTFREGFLQDFEDFERAGVITIKNKDVYDKVQELRKIFEAVKPDEKK